MNRKLTAFDKLDYGRLPAIANVALRHLSSEIRDTVYVRSRGQVDMTKPRRFYGILNERCNLKCQGCNYWRLPHYVDEMSADEWIRILKDLKEFVGPYHINFSGGEPLLKRGLFDILNFCRDNQILAGMTTNAIILRERQAAQIVDAKLFSLNISLDGSTAETHDEQRGVVGSFHGVVRTIDLIQEHSAKVGVHVPIIIKPTVSRINLAEMPALVKMVTAKGVNGVLFQPIHDWGTKEIKDLWVNDIPSLELVIEQILELKKSGYPILSSEWHIRDWVRHFKREPRPVADQESGIQCWVGLTTLVILTDGTVANCGTLEPIGNIRIEPIRGIWYSPTAKERRAQSSKCTIGCSENCTIKRGFKQKVEGAMRLLSSY